MSVRLKVSVVLGLFCVAGFAWATISNQPELVDVPVSEAYIPGGFDSNDRAQMVVAGYFTNTCYRLGPTEKTIDESTGTLSIRQKAYKYKGPCLMMMVPYSETVKIGILKAKDYKVVDGKTGNALGELPIKEAVSEEADDYMYAIVRDAYVAEVEGVKTIILQGELPGSCWTFADKKVVEDGKNVVTVMPILQKVDGAECSSEVRIPFVTTVSLPSGRTGRILLHVRSLNGEAINKVIDL